MDRSSWRHTLSIQTLSTCPFLGIVVCLRYEAAPSPDASVITGDIHRSTLSTGAPFSRYRTFRVDDCGLLYFRRRQVCIDRHLLHMWMRFVCYASPAPRRYWFQPPSSAQEVRLGQTVVIRDCSHKLQAQLYWCDTARWWHRNVDACTVVVQWVIVDVFGKACDGSNAQAECRHITHAATRVCISTMSAIAPRPGHSARMDRDCNGGVNGFR